jgi:hypothetical protein
VKRPAAICIHLGFAAVHLRAARDSRPFFRGALLIGVHIEPVERERFIKPFREARGGGFVHQRQFAIETVGVDGPRGVISLTF